MTVTKGKYNSKVSPIEACPECSSTRLLPDYETGEIICRDCGLVIREMMMDPGKDYRAFTREEESERRRYGDPTSYSKYDKGLSTAIGRVDRDAFGRKLPLDTRLQMWRLRKWHIRSRIHSSEARNLVYAMNELDRMSDKTYIPSSIKEKAAVIYRKALDKGIIRGRSILGITAASLYVACRQTETPRSLREIADASLVDKKVIARCYRLLVRELGIQMPLADPLTYVSKIAEKTGITGPTQGRAIEILREAKRKHVASGKDPMGLAAAALYIACKQKGEKKTQKDVAEAAQVTEVTVRNRYKGLKRRLGLEMPD